MAVREENTHSDLVLGSFQLDPHLEDCSIVLLEKDFHSSYWLALSSSLLVCFFSHCCKEENFFVCLIKSSFCSGIIEKFCYQFFCTVFEAFACIYWDTIPCKIGDW